MSEEMKPKKRAPSRRRVAAVAMADSPAPTDVECTGPTCGHEGAGCQGGACQVRYVGPTTSIRDHHAVHAARGVSHVWTAAIVSGLAIVLTGAVAWTAVEAQVRKVAAPTSVGSQMTKDDGRAILRRLEDLERAVKDVKTACMGEDQQAAIVPDRKVETKPVTAPKIIPTTIDSN